MPKSNWVQNRARGYRDAEKGIWDTKFYENLNDYEAQIEYEAGRIDYARHLWDMKVRENA